MRKIRTLTVAAAVVGLLATTGLPALADNVQNDVVVGGNDTFTAGGSTNVGYRITSNNGDGENGCNATPSSPARVTPLVPSGVTATPPFVDITSCANTYVQVTFSSATPGSYVIAVSVTDGGAGSYNTSPARFTLRVEPKADTTGPVITKTITGLQGLDGWYTSDVSVAWTVTDPESAVTIDEGCGTQPFTAETAGTTSSCSAHSAGGTASDSVDLKIDKTGPTAVLTPAGTAGANGWYTSDVTVTTGGDDLVSGGVTCTAPQSLTNETSRTQVTGSCTNAAGLSTNASPISIKIDKTGPSAVLTPAGTAGANGWYTSDVTVTTGGDDLVSGGVTCTAPQSLTSETTGTAVTGSCTNSAGLITPAAPITVKIDKTNPTASLVITNSPSFANGWYTSPVEVGTQGSDTVSTPVVCTAPQTFADDGADQTVDGSCTNDAGLTQPAEQLSLDIDATAPTNVTLTPSGTTGANGWYTSDVVVTTTGEDATSGVTCTTEQTFSAESASITVNGSCTNGAGLTTAATPITVKIDKTAPSASIQVSGGTLGDNGWYTSPVTADASGTDTVSDPVTCEPATHTQSADTTGVSFSSTCTNDAGLTAPASLAVKVDQTGPTAITITGGPAAGASYYFGFVPAAPTGCTATDGTSGLASCVITGYSTAVGTHTIVATARDNAGNEGTAERTYTVMAWETRGFFQPVDMNGVLNTVKGGSTVPLKFEAFAGSVELTDISIVDHFTVKGIPCPGATIPTDDIELTTTGGTALRFDATGGQFVQNWQTPKKSGVCYRVSVHLVDGGAIAADFKLK